MEKVKLEIVGLTTGQSNKSSYTLILGEVNGQMKLPIVIGAFEAQSIALVMEGISPQRPLTHDLFKNFAIEFDITLKEIYINNLIEGVFFASLICEDKNGLQVEIDSRTSDAIALALRFSCDIFTNRSILESAGIILQEEEITDEPQRPESDDDVYIKEEGTEMYNSLSLEELQILLDEAIQVEDYDKAALIRDEINKRQRN